MRLKTLTLRNFRNYAALDVDFSDSINILVGDNASGKSNLLESIYMLCMAKSHRTSIDDEMIYHGQPFFYLKGSFEEPLGQLLVEISNSIDGKKLVKIDGKYQQRISNLIGRVRVVLFSTESIDIIKGSPPIRRKFLDQLISQISMAYLQNLQTYYSVLKQRNELLKKIRDFRTSRDLIEPWDVQIAEAGVYIISEREKLIDKLARLSKTKHYQLTENAEKLDIYYKPSINLSEIDKSDSVSFYLRTLRSVLEKEIMMGTTIIGPHRDDFDILVNDFEAKRFCSQGQQRTIALSIKLAEMECIASLRENDQVRAKQRKRASPLLLLDDVGSELDERRVKLVYELIDRLGIQTFITATRLDTLKDYFLGDYYEFIVENGSIKKTDR